MQKIFDRDILKELFVNEFISNDYESWVQIYEKLTTTTNFDNTPVNMDDVENLKRKTLSNKQFFAHNGIPSETPDFKWYYGRRYDANNIGLKHRIYINFKRQDVVNMAYLFIGKCIKYDVKFVFKYTKFSNNFDKFIIYSTDEQLPIYKTIIEELENENKEVFDRIGDAPITSYTFGNNYGYAPEIENSGTSFNQRCAEALMEAFRLTLLDLSKDIHMDDFSVPSFLYIFLHNNLLTMSETYGEDKEVFRINFPRKEFISYFENIKPKFIERILNQDISEEMLKNNDSVASFSINDRRYNIYANDIIDLRKTLFKKIKDKYGEEYVYDFLLNKVKEIFTKESLIFDLPKELSYMR